MSKLLILKKLKKYYNFKKDAEFARFLGISPQLFANWKARNTFDAQLHSGDFMRRPGVFQTRWL